MSTYVQGLKIIELHKKGWREPIEGLTIEDVSGFNRPEKLDNTPIGGPYKMEDPEGKPFWIMPDGSLEEVDDNSFDVV